VDYAKETGSFYDWLETNTLTDSAIALWHALMHTCSKAGWPEEFSVAVSTLSTKAGLKKDAIGRARVKLQEMGRIEFESRSGQQSAIYRIIPFHIAALKTTQTASQTTQNNDSGVLSDTNRVANRAQTASIIKDLSSSSASSSYESFYAAHIRVFGFECNPIQVQELGDYIEQDGMDEAVVVRAIERAGLKSKEGYNFSFILRILNDYIDAGVRTVSAAVAADEQYQAKKESSSSSRPNPSRPSSRSSPPVQSSKQRRSDDLRRKAEEARRLEEITSH
jgi:DnaD/phage-associated family protein